MFRFTAALSSPLRPGRILVAILGLASPAFTAEPAAPMVVRTVAPLAASTSRPYEVPGRTEPFEAATLFTRATGIVQARHVDIGDVVKAGDVLAVIATPDLDRAVEAARAAVEQAAARAANARTLAERATTLLGTGATSREEYDQRSAAASELEAAVRVARAELARLEEQQKFASVRAPFDAVIAARNFDRGDRVRGDSATSEGWLYRVVRLDRLRFAVSATPDLALRLARDHAASIRFHEFPGRRFGATVARSSQIFDAASGTMRVELVIENPDLSLPAGLTGTAVFDLKPVPGTVLVPTNTVMVRDGKSLLATVQDGKVALVEIAPGRNLGPTIEAVSPSLSPQTQVIINPNALLRPGDAVEAKPLAPAS